MASRNKKRLYIALYPNNVTNSNTKKSSYHWAFLVGPKLEKSLPVPGTRYHVKNVAANKRSAGAWIYEETIVPNVADTVNLLGRILIAKIEDERGLVTILRTTPTKQGDSNWHCCTWIAEVLSRLAEDGKVVGTSQLDWATIEPKAHEYIDEKEINP